LLELDGQEFAALGGLAYFDTPTQGVPVAEGAEALKRAVLRWEAGDADWREWERDAEAARSSVAALLGCRASDVALVPSVVAAAATVAAQLAPGRIVVADREYRSNLLPWLAQRRFGREVTVLEGDGVLSERIVDEIGDDVALVAVSSVQSSDGARADLGRIVAAAHEREVSVFVDATQSMGVLATEAVAADFVAAAGYKWLLGARGTGYFYVRPGLQESYWPVLAGPMSAADVVDGRYYGEPYRPFDDARRFDQSLAWLSWVAARPGLETLARVGIRRLERHALGLASRFREGCLRLGLERSLSGTELPSPVVALSVPDPDGLQRELLRHGVKASVRPSGVRFGFHLYNDHAQVDRALEVLARYGAARGRPSRVR
jgi:selenocysteine lyase/cysteine desulfurase